MLLRMNSRASSRALAVTSLLLLGATLFGHLRSGVTASQAPSSNGWRWWKGNLHTHTFWSDGDDFPEMIVSWYKEHGYHFLALSDHNVLSEGERWVDAEKHANGAIAPALLKYRQQLGPWVDERREGDRPLVRLKPLSEFRPLFDQAGRFLLIQSEEITDKFEQLPVHLNATNLQEAIAPQSGSSVREILQRNIDAVLDQKQRTGTPMIVHVNHPNFGWGVTADDIAQLKGERFFEVHNGHASVRNYGDESHPGAETIWDLVLAARLTHSGELLYGLGTDDAHNYHKYGVGRDNPGRAWIMVRSRYLTPESIVAAMERGDFYASTGVRLEDTGSDGRSVWLRINADPGVDYETEFIATMKPERQTTPQTKDKDAGAAPVLDQIGTVIARSKSLAPRYEFCGRELYVRMRVRSNRLHPNPYATGDFEMAWTQPVVPAGR
jgi:hypothetical protein